MACLNELCTPGVSEQCHHAADVLMNNKFMPLNTNVMSACVSI